MNSIAPEGYISISDIIAKYDLSQKTLYNYRDAAWWFKSIKIKRKVYYLEKELVSYLDQIWYLYNDNKSVERIEKKDRGSGEDVVKNSEPTKSNHNQDNVGNSYLFTVIEELKTEKKTLIEEKKEHDIKQSAKYDELNNKLMEEMKKVEKTFFVSERFQRNQEANNKLILNIIELVRDIWWGRDINVNDIKKLLIPSVSQESIQINHELREVNIWVNQDSQILNEIQSLPNELVLGKSKNQELKKKNNIIIFLCLFITVMITVIVLFYFTQFSF